jgi:hypothetical protein
MFIPLRSAAASRRHPLPDGRRAVARRVSPVRTAADGCSTTPPSPPSSPPPREAVNLPSGPNRAAPRSRNHPPTANSPTDAHGSASADFVEQRSRNPARSQLSASALLVTKGWIPGSFPMGVAAICSGPPSRSTPPSRSRHAWRSSVRSKPTDHTRPPSASLSDTGGLPFEGAGECWDTRRTGEEGGPHAAHASSLGQPRGQLPVGARETHNEWQLILDRRLTDLPALSDLTNHIPLGRCFMVLDREPFVRAPGTWTT